MGTKPRLYRLAWSCVVLIASAAHGQVSISIPAGAPLVLSPSNATPVTVVVSPGTDTIESGSVRLFHRVRPAPFQAVVLAAGGGGSYSGELPASACGSTVEWYASVTGIVTGVVTEPPGGEGAPFQAAVGTITPIASFNFQTAPGWTVTGTPVAGAWALGVPVGCNRGDPPTDYDGSGSCYLTQPSTVVSPPTCDSDVDGGTTRLISPVFNVSAMANPHVAYARWFSNSTGSAPHEDSMHVEVSGDSGSSWQTLETVGPTSGNLHPEVNGGWMPRLFHIGELNLSGAHFRVRFVVSDQGAASTVEAAVDAFAIVDLSCGSVTCLRGDVNGDQIVNGRDVARFVHIAVSGGATATEVCSGDLQAQPDGAVGAADIPAFAACLLAGGCS